MISLLTAFLLATGEASWYWWAMWVVLAFGNILKFVEEN